MPRVHREHELSGEGGSSPDSAAVSSIPQTSGKLSWKPCPTLTPPLVPPPLHRSVSARNIRGWQPEVPAPLPSRFLRGGGPEPGPPEQSPRCILLWYRRVPWTPRVTGRAGPRPDSSQLGVGGRAERGEDNSPIASSRPPPPARVDRSPPSRLPPGM